MKKLSKETVKMSKEKLDQNLNDICKAENAEGNETSGSSTPNPTEDLERLMSTMLERFESDRERDRQLYQLEIQLLRNQLQLCERTPNINSSSLNTCAPVFCPQPTITNPTVEQPSNRRHNLRFDDIANSFKKFKGDYYINVFAWLQHFDEQSKVFQFTPLEKFVFSKKLLEGRAKNFVEFESSATCYEELAKELMNEFGKSINSSLIHRKLQDRKKKKDETPIQYLYEMFALASQSDLDTAAIITYTINGLPGPNHLKAHMYEADNLKDFKRKLMAYEIQFAMIKHEPSRGENNEIGKRKPDDKISIQRCFNCGDQSHSTPDCPDKSKGPKCFKCNNFGHTSLSCVVTVPVKRFNVISPAKNQVRKNIEINNVKSLALFDTGSDYTVVREDIIENKNIPCEIEYFEEEIKGVGGISKLKGKFNAKIQIDDEFHDMVCYVISKDDIDDEIIIGLDLIRNCEMILSPNNFQLRKAVKNIRHL